MLVNNAVTSLELPQGVCTCVKAYARVVLAEVRDLCDMCNTVLTALTNAQE
jgi:hypothetical protein